MTAARLRQGDGDGNGSVTHDHILQAIGQLQGQVAEIGTASAEHRRRIDGRIEALDKKVDARTNAIDAHIADIKVAIAQQKPPGVAYAVIKLFEKHPWLVMVLCGTGLLLGADRVIALWELFK